MKEGEVKDYDNHSTNEHSKDVLRVILRCCLNKNKYFYIDKSKIMRITELRGKVKNNLKLEEEEKLKLFFKGKILEDEKDINEYNLEHDDIILYIITGNNRKNTNNNFTRYFTDNPDEKRGFSRLKDNGLKEEEILEMRESFHYFYYEKNNEDVLLLIDDMLTREEAWLGGETMNDIQTTEIYEIKSDDPKQNILKVLFESNYVYLYAFIIGFFLNIYSVLFLTCCEFQPKFKLGLRIGMTISIFIFCIYYVKSS